MFCDSSLPSQIAWPRSNAYSEEGMRRGSITHSRFPLPPKPRTPPLPATDQSSYEPFPFASPTPVSGDVSSTATPQNHEHSHNLPHHTPYTPVTDTPSLHSPPAQPAEQRLRCRAAPPSSATTPGTVDDETHHQVPGVPAPSTTHHHPKRAHGVVKHSRNDLKRNNKRKDKTVSLPVTSKKEEEHVRTPKHPMPTRHRTYQVVSSLTSIVVTLTQRKKT
ncbi:collagen alpha-1(XXVII) chain-like [Penaeus monodon]|uniref:collagen alpha-1(XXVII) chain-like n=1 Tax=Penaeus monodon TaxID=6687 RepID=UPI0018A7ACC9|nr:collagen alpha-1(XXVII) chain-like [Penaeus monodon]